jgi:transposase
VITDAAGVPLVVQTGPANQRDEDRVLPMLEALPPLTDTQGNRQDRPKAMQGDAGYGFPWTALLVWLLGIVPMLKPRTKRGQPAEHGSGMGRTRYVVERTLAWFAAFRRIRICYERTGAHFQGFHELAACVICARKLRHARRRF